MPRKIHVTPRPGVKVRNPQTSLHLPPEGAMVMTSAYWLRRLSEGDVTETKPAKGKSKE